MRSPSLLVLCALLAHPLAVAAARCATELSVAFNRTTSLADGTVWDEDSRVAYPPGYAWKESGDVWRGCLCVLRPCLRKCCPAGQAFNASSRRCDREPPEAAAAWRQLTVHDALAPDLAFAASAGPPHFATLVGEPCRHGRFRLRPDRYPEDAFSLLSSGELLVNATAERFDASRYCLEFFDDSAEVGAIGCFLPEPVVAPAEVVRGALLLASVPFLLATFALHALVPRRRKLHGWNVMSYVASTTVSYLALAAVQLFTNHVSGTLCTAAAFIIYFSFLASFFWLNVMCFDIFWTFSGFRSLRGTAREREHKKFIIYSIYSWGCPLILLSVTLVMQFHNDIPDGLLRPQFGVKRCWFPDDITILAYFYGPVGVLVLCNIILFILTAIRIAQLKRETAMLKGTDSRRHDDDNRQRFNLYLKLFLVMGVNWSMEVISGLVGGPEYVWYVTDICNTLQGVLIFVIFVWKDRIRRMLMEKFCPKRASTKLSKSTVVTYSTRASPSRLSHGVLNNKVTDNSNGDVVKITAITPISDDSDVP
ncbi:G-protein coupled receptor Mth2-like isoform X3 [Schistocerca gregaria]|uniref:G-protein coupled receptor Mth2-like isoform X3 n=1 Tax=Schistocerca gregaria TaxID=7010 RepID=UPI00211DBACF|nr:G-protein coupled receptor Mth2-like isoform X3 [Schistocerca gregaria]